MNESEQLKTYDVTQHDLVSSKDHKSDVGIASFEMDVAPHCKFKHVDSREGDIVGLTSDFIEPCEQ